jgi:hypothetical protein
LAGSLDLDVEPDRVSGCDASGTRYLSDREIRLRLSREEPYGASGKHIGWDIGDIFDLTVTDHDERAIRG